MCAGGGGRNKEPSKHGESVSSKAHKYSSRVLISPTHTRARRNTARAPAATPLLARTTIAKTTFANCAGLHRRMGAGGGRRTHSHTHPGQAHQGAPSRDPCPADAAREREDTRLGSHGPSTPKLCRIVRKAGAEGKPKGGSVHVHTPPAPGAGSRRGPSEPLQP